MSDGQREEERLCRAERVVFSGAFGAAKSASRAAIQILHKREPKAKQAPQNAHEERATMELGSKEKKRGGPSRKLSLGGEAVAGGTTTRFTAGSYDGRPAQPTATDESTGSKTKEE